MQKSPERQKTAEQITLLGAGLDLILGISKILTGIFSYSSALVMDGIHSLSDLVTDAIVIIMLRISYAGPDEDHPWGHARFETIATVLLGSMIIAVALTMAYEAFKLLDSPNIKTPEWPTLVIVIISILSKEWIFRRTLKIGQEQNSSLLISNAWHSRTDAYSSIIVLLGIMGAMLGILWLDAFVAIVVSGFVAKVGIEMIWQSVEELVDTALPPEKIKAYTEVIMQLDNIQDVEIKSRKMAGNSHLEIYLRLHLSLSSSEAHHIGHLAAQRLENSFTDIDHIVFHVDTCDKENEELVSYLPLRAEIKNKINNALSQQTPPIPEPIRMVLHYNKQVSIELFFNKDEVEQTNLAEILKQVLQNPSWLKKIRVWEGNDR